MVTVVALELLSPVAWPIVRHRMGFKAPHELMWATVLLGFLAALPLVLEQFRPGLIGRITGTERVWAPLLVSAVILVGGYLVWQRQMTDRYRTMRSFCAELKGRIEGPDVQVGYFQELDRAMLFYLGREKPIWAVETEEELQDFLSSPAHAKVLIAQNDIREELVSGFPEGIPREPTLKEETYPWEKGPKKLEAWVIRDQAE